MGHLVSTYIFGSVGRGEQDAKSDLDILAIVKNQQGKVPDGDVLRLVPPAFAHLKPSIAWYGERRLAEMFDNGELFAWHLYFEAKPLSGPENVLKSLGKPNRYLGALADTQSFEKVMRGIPKQIEDNGFNAVYESGLLYVCLRNIAMAASSVLCERPDFSRYSPFLLKEVPSCPISVEDFEVTMICRLSGQRGHSPPDNVNGGFVRSLYDRLSPWVGEIVSILERRNHG